MQSTIQKNNTSLIAIIAYYCKNGCTAQTRAEKNTLSLKKSLQKTLFEIKCNTFTLKRRASFAEKGAGTFDRRLPRVGWLATKGRPGFPAKGRAVTSAIWPAGASMAKSSSADAET